MTSFEYKNLKINKKSNIPGVVPTIPSSDYHTDGTWIATDLYQGELFVNTYDEKIWMRCDNRIIQLSSVPSNYIGVPKAITASYSMLVTDTYLFGNTTSNVDLYLVNASTYSYHILTIKNINIGEINVIPYGTNKIDGESNMILTQYDSMSIVAATSKWYII